MNETAAATEAELIRRYVEEKSEAAFAAVVRGRVDFVYSAVRRRVGGDARMAEEVAQQVFVALARGARGLIGRASLDGWLYTTTRFVAARAVRGERRRRKRETEAHVMNEQTGEETPAADWARLRPVLDAAMDELKEAEREAILLRFFAGRNFAEIGAQWALGENAARMRVERALDKLQGLLARRGVTSTAGALAMVLGEQAVTAAPAGLAAKVAGSALAEAAAAMVGAIKFGAAAMATIAVLATAAAIYQTRQANEKAEAIHREMQELQRRLKIETDRAESTDRDNARLLAAVARVSEAKKMEQPITKQIVLARLKRADELTSGGRGAEALAEYLWCLDEGVPRFAALETYRAYLIPNQIYWLAQSYAPALAVLRRRREEIERSLRADQQNFEQASDLVGINRALREPARAVEEMERYPKGDARRTALAALMRDDSMEGRRYAEVLEGRWFQTMNTEFEVLLQYSLSGTNPPEVPPGAPKDMFHQYQPTLASAARDIEALAGGGDLEHARQLAKRVLDFDDSEATRRMIREHTARAGQPGLLDSFSPR